VAVHSAGILLVRGHGASRDVLIGHIGGPFWARKDEGAWSIPKGEYDPETENAWDAARREFEEELGLSVPEGPTTELGVFRVTSSKQLTVFRVAADLDVMDAVFGEFELEWPPRSGRVQRFPEMDRVLWSSIVLARTRLVTGQRRLLDLI